MRESLLVDDLANSNKPLLSDYTQPTTLHINIGSGQEVSIARLAKTNEYVIGFDGMINYYIIIPNVTFVTYSMLPRLKY